jgi:hypothetical protein
MQESWTSGRNKLRIIWHTGVAPGVPGKSRLADQQPAFRKKSRGEKEIIAYWLPLAGYPEVFVHFVIGAIVDYDAASETRA